MRVIRIRMLKTHDQLQAGQFYNQDEETACFLMANGFAVGPDEFKPVGPSEIKPAGPSEVKAKKKLSRARTARES